MIVLQLAYNAPYTTISSYTTGTAGILYRPKFFHPVVFEEGFRNVTRTADDMMFRLAALAQGTYVVTGCPMGLHWTCPHTASITNTYKYPTLWEHDNPWTILQTMTDKQLELGVTSDKIQSLIKGRKKLGGLFDNFNAKGGNDASWELAMEYLKYTGVMDVPEVGYQYYKKERREGVVKCNRHRE